MQLPHPKKVLQRKQLLKLRLQLRLQKRLPYRQKSRSKQQHKALAFTALHANFVLFL
jgi:hypothetical protein